MRSLVRYGRKELLILALANRGRKVGFISALPLSEPLWAIKRINMKKIILFLLFGFALGCSNNQHNDLEKKSKQEQKGISKESNQSKEDYSIIEIPTGYDNTRYYLRTTPYFDSISENYMCEILLWNPNDTVFLIDIDADTLINTIISEKNQSSDSISIDQLKEYKLIDVFPRSGIRAYRAYLTSILSNEFNKIIVVDFEIQVFPFYNYDAGTLITRGYYYDDDLSYEKEKEEIKTAHNNR